VGVVLGCGASKRRSEDQVAGSGGTSGTGGSAGAPSGAGGKAANVGGAGAPPLVDNPFPCENPTPIFDGTSGFVECDNGYRYRESVGTCTVERRTEDVSAGLPDPECRYDADCADDPLGYCTTGTCYTGCLTDSDCGGDWICSCSSEYGIGNCTRAFCTSDADCLPGLHCALVIDGTSDAAFYTYACQSEEDECVSDDDCPPLPPNWPGNCELEDQTSRRYCLK
jgi:hypothetical protein